MPDQEDRSSLPPEARGPAASRPRPGVYRRAQFPLGLQGLALLRQWLTGDEREIQARLDDIVALVHARDDLGPWEVVELPELEIREGYVAWAGVYDTRPNPIIHMEEPVVRRLIDEVPPGVALDAACGTGRYTQYLEAAGHGVVGLDVTPGMLDRARTRVPGARFALGSLEALPLKSETVDLAVCTLSLTHCESLGEPIAELARVVRPGGRVILSDVHPFVVALGAQAVSLTFAGARGFVRNHVHWPSSYVAAFAAAGLEVRQCLEPTWGEEEVAMQGEWGISLEAARAAALGWPGVLIWDLVRR